MNKHLIDILNGKPVRTALSEDAFAAEGLSKQDIADIQREVDEVLRQVGAFPHFFAKVENYGQGFKVILQPSLGALSDIRRKIDAHLIDDLHWEQLDSEFEALPSGSLVDYFRP